MAAQLKNLFTPNSKRGRNVSTDSDNTPAKKKPQTLTSSPEESVSNISKEPVYMSNIDMDMRKEDNTTKDQNSEWINKLLIQVSDISKQQKVDSLQLNNISLCSNMMEAKLDEALLELSLSKKKIENLAKQVQTVTEENILLKKRLSEAETYSKKNNIKNFGIPESKEENTKDLMDKLTTVLSTMDIHLSNLYIDNIHRLPTNTRGPRPLIVKFTSFLDRQLVWNNRHMLANSNLQVYIREHFSAEVEEDIKVLLPIRRAAILQKLKVRLTANKLYINNQVYTTSTLNLLPDNLKPENMAIKEINNHLFFFSKYSFLSNFSPANFTINGTDYTCSEQYIQHQKALLFKAKDTARKIMLTNIPGQMKRLNTNLSNFNQDLWEQKAPDICYTALKDKFAQNPELQKKLQEIEDKVLIEAFPYDNVWGIGFSKDEPNLFQKKSSWGTNIQGKMLMKVRSEINM